MIPSINGVNSGWKALWVGCACTLLVGCSAEEPGPIASDSLPRSSPRKRKADVETGRFRALLPLPDATLTNEQREQIAQLEAIGYLSGSQESAGSGVTTHRPRATWPGLNLYTSGHAPVAVLMDMDGSELHRWEHSFEAAWPERKRPADLIDKEFWRRVHLYDNGDLLAIFGVGGLIKINANSDLIWANPLPAHHDLDVLPNGDIYVLTRVAHVVPRVLEAQPVLEDFITILNHQGHEKLNVSLLAAFENSEFAHLLYESQSDDDRWVQKKWDQGDFMHTNSLEVLDGRLAKRIPAFRKGNVLVSLRVPSVVAVIDLERGKVVWAFRGAFKHQHDPKILTGGNMLLFDNLGSRHQSSVIEVNPETHEVLWEFRGSEKIPFFSRSCGAAERLPNGNTLVTESDNGRALEITPEGTIVWEFYNPERAGDHRQYIATLFELLRLPPDLPTEWMRATKIKP